MKFYRNIITLNKALTRQSTRTSSGRESVCSRFRNCDIDYGTRRISLDYSSFGSRASFETRANINRYKLLATVGWSCRKSDARAAADSAPRDLLADCVQTDASFCGSSDARYGTVSASVSDSNPPSIWPHL